MCRSAVGKDITQRVLSACGLTLQHAHMTSPSKNFNLLNFFPYFVSQKKLFRVPNPSILIAAKLYQREVLFCLLCFHPPSWYFSHEHFGSRTVFASLACVLWDSSACLCNTTNVQMASQDVRCQCSGFAFRIMRLSWIPQMTDVHELSECGVLYGGLLVPEISFSREFANYKMFDFKWGGWWWVGGWRPHGSRHLFMEFC